MKVAVQGLELLEKIGSARVEEYRGVAKERWTLARVLDTKEERRKVKSDWEEKEKAAKTNGSSASDANGKDDL